MGLTSCLYLHAQAGSGLVQKDLGTTLSPAGSTRAMSTTHSFWPLAARYPEGWQLVLFSHLKSLSEELGPDPPSNRSLPGLALALVRAFLPSSANSTEALLGAKFCDKDPGYRAEFNTKSALEVLKDKLVLVIGGGMGVMDRLINRPV